MDLRIRPFSHTDEDREAIAALTRRVDPEGASTAAELRHRDAALDPERYFRQRIIAESGSTAVGWGSLEHLPSQFHPDRYQVQLQVDPDRRRRGVGGALLARLLEIAAGRGAELVRGEARASWPESLAWAERRGFRELRRGWESTLDLAGFDPAPHLEAVGRVSARGVEIRALPGLRAADPGFLARYHAAWLIPAHDEPEPDPVTPLPFEAWLADEVEPPNAVPELHLLAMRGAEIVGFTALHRDGAQPGTGTFVHSLTGTMPAWRGTGVATALKAEATRRAIALGARRIRTYNDTANAPMVAINDRFGFVRGDAWVVLERPLR